MPVVINIAVNLLLGACLVLNLQRSPALRQGLFSWSLLVLLAFQALVFTPAATYVFRFYPQWSMLYWLDPQIFPQLDRWIGWLSVLAIVLNFVAMFLGYMTARAGVLIDMLWLRWAPVVVALGIFAYVGVGYWDRLAYVGDYDAFWQGQATLLFKTAPGWTGVGLLIATVTLVAWIRARFGDHDPSLI